ncbi:MAG: DUF2029 domain-containing protein [Lachnospiraceae bacterium]|nr:DUF2029 domain-containing protein [Lachnospiraceae bacterium]
MLPFDKKLREYLRKNAEMVFILLVTVGGVVGRFFLWDIYTGDLGGYLIWYERAKKYGGLPGIYALGQKIKGYNALFQLLTAALTHIPVDPQYLFKFVWTLFDGLLAWGVGRLVYDICGTKDRAAFRKGAFAYGLSFLAMNVIFNSAAWGQSDAVYVSLIIWSLVWLFRDKYLKSFVLLGLAFAFKLQTVFILPFFAFYYVYKKSFSCLYFLTLPGMLIVSALPRQIVGLLSPISAQAAESAAIQSGADFAAASENVARMPGIIDVYIAQIASGGKLYMEYPSFWAFFPDLEADVFTDFYKFRNAAIVFTMMILIVLVAALLRRKEKYTDRELIYVALLLCLTTVFFLPCMIDRYGYIYEILAIVLIFLDKRSIVPAAVMHITMNYQIAGRVGMETIPVSIQKLSFIMLLVYGMYLYLCFTAGKEEKHAGV